MRLASFLIALLVPSLPALGQEVVDGDTIKLGGATYRLHGIDAPELTQSCADGWPAGREASRHLQGLMIGRSISCERVSLDRYGRTVALCRADGVDLGALMVAAGQAWAFTRYSTVYVSLEEEARSSGLGVHGRQCTPAWLFRAGRYERSTPRNTR